MFFQRFHPASVDPAHFVGRERDLRWLTEQLSGYLRLDGEPAALPICIAGAKGVGKSILTRAAVTELRATFSGSTLFTCVDCRSCHSRRAVLSAIINEVVRELDSLRRATADIPESLLATAQVLMAIARLDAVELKVAHEHVLQYKRAAELSGSQSLLNVLNLKFGLSVERTEKQVKSLNGSVNFDDIGLVDALVGLFRDIRAQGLNVVLYLDNIDELRHEYADGDARDAVRRDVEGVLSIARAPIALVMNMRKYYTGVLPREVTETRVLRPLPGAALRAILDRRLSAEREEVRAAFEGPKVSGAVSRLLDGAPTPLSFLLWTKFLFQEDALTPTGLAEGFDWYLESYYSNIEPEVLKAVAAAFPNPGGSVTHVNLLAVCGDNQALVDQLLDRQVVLPRDFWNPVAFTLDPELSFLHPANGIVDVAATG